MTLRNLMTENPEFKVFNLSPREITENLDSELFEIYSGTQGIYTWKVVEGGFEFVLCYRNEIPLCAIYGYEISNPFIFSDVLIVPGHDSIGCVNLLTMEAVDRGIR